MEAGTASIKHWLGDKKRDPPVSLGSGSWFPHDVIALSIIFIKTKKREREKRKEERTGLSVCMCCHDLGRHNGFEKMFVLPVLYDEFLCLVFIRCFIKHRSDVEWINNSASKHEKTHFPVGNQEDGKTKDKRRKRERAQKMTERRRVREGERGGGGGGGWRGVEEDLAEAECLALRAGWIKAI